MSRALLRILRSELLGSAHAAAEVPSTSQQASRSIMSSSKGKQLPENQEGREEVMYDDEGQANQKLKFVSRERKLVPRPPFYRPPIYFPDVTLQMMRLTKEQRKQIWETGWTREVAFKTTPNVTKLEIKGILESLYGMSVERVHTANYLGRKHVTYTPGKRTARYLWRADDWKKAYVIFRPPPGMEVPPRVEGEQEGTGTSSKMLEQLLEASGVKTATPTNHQTRAGE